MILLAFSIFDAAAVAYLPPMFLATKGMAIRSFSDAINEEGHMFGLHAEDYTLFHIGSFDQGSGKFSAIVPDSLGNALMFVVKPDIAPVALES